MRAPLLVPEPLTVEWPVYVAVLEDRASWQRTAQRWERRCRRLVILAAAVISGLLLVVIGGAR